MPNGIIVIDKPAGWTSMDVCAKLRGVFREKRIGHAGTLDPMATGVLPVFVGRATRAVEFAAESDKEYMAGLKLGVITDTQDTTGNVLEERSVQVTRLELEKAVEQFWGDIRQVPPMYSAIKVGGKKLYELARKGKEVERAPRPVTISVFWPVEQLGQREYLMRICCSKGTYVRTLCHDLGQALGCGGAMSSLRRVKAAGFTLDDAVPLETVVAAAERGEAEGLLLRVDEYFARNGWSGAINVSPQAEKRLRNGAAVPLPGVDGSFRVYSGSGEFLGLGAAENGTLRLVKSFYEV
ncbi:tRNA pseudouridine(55) synthase TruB [Pseudoflavonifractor phocaeensis]|uniref:tRNA pseudouridine(55) synthase TruB n=1 Tax=Pseudoflavonifractor phocaeensis TaxID=1870988 RepID=UPI00210E4CD0|nr:tRNA pseudouridine(55) synthase TruB [Pseudoflavonifractor phocaeensis]MCQ4865524.1 tRNA pseudouridine(55) synthase TruB [Pseudoflavonifractor phocaeensis]